MVAIPRPSDRQDTREHKEVLDGLANVLTGQLAANPVINGALTINGHLTWTTDNTYDVGASGATRPRDLFLARNLTIGGGILGPTYTSWTPGVSQNGARTVSGASGGYITFGKFCHLYAEVTITNAGTAGFAVTLTGVPAAVAPLSTSATRIQGTFQIFRGGVNFRNGMGVFTGATTIIGQAHAEADAIGTAAGGNFAVANGDVVSVNMMYALA